MSIQQPHDHFFWESFTKPEIIHSFLQEYLPPALLAQIDLSTLILQSDRHQDENLRPHQTDLLYRVEWVDGGDAFLYLLFEHKSYPDRWVLLQLLRYMVQKWQEQAVKEKAEYLTPIIPIIVYHGEKKWGTTTDFQGLFAELPFDIQAYTPQFQSQLYDFSHLSDVEIRGEDILQVCLRVLRGIFDPQLREKLPALLEFTFRLAERQTGLEYIYTILYYMSVATEKIDMQTMKQALQTQGKQGEQLMNTIAKKLIEEGRELGLKEGIFLGREEGREEGLEEGREEGREEGVEVGLARSIIRLLERKFGKVPASLSQQLTQYRLAALQILFDHAIDISSLEAFSQALAELPESEE